MNLRASVRARRITAQTGSLFAFRLHLARAAPRFFVHFLSAAARCPVAVAPVPVPASVPVPPLVPPPLVSPPLPPLPPPPVGGASGTTYVLKARSPLWLAQLAPASMPPTHVPPP